MSKQTVKSTNERIDELILKGAKYKVGQELQHTSVMICMMSSIRVIITSVHVKGGDIFYKGTDIDGFSKGQQSSFMKEEDLKEVSVSSPTMNIEYHDVGCILWDDIWKPALVIYAVVSMIFTPVMIFKHYIL